MLEQSDVCGAGDDDDDEADNAIARKEVELGTTEEEQAIMPEQSDVCGTGDADEDEADNAVASKPESQSADAVRPGLSLRNSTDKEPEQRTDIEAVPTLNYKPRFITKNNNDLTLVVSNESTDTRESDQRKENQGSSIRQEIPHIITYQKKHRQGKRGP